jgi:hypothetical protein
MMAFEDEDEEEEQRTQLRELRWRLHSLALACLDIEPMLSAADLARELERVAAAVQRRHHVPRSQLPCPTCGGNGWVN